MNRFLKYWRITGRGEKFQAQVVNYADDFVILGRHCATEALNWTRGVMTRIGLTLNDAKTSTKEARAERRASVVSPRRRKLAYDTPAGR
jgi:RNA-directed DNA polymerase